MPWIFASGDVEVWRGGAEENILTRMRPCEICKALIRRDCLFLQVEIKEEQFLKMVQKKRQRGCFMETEVKFVKSEFSQFRQG